MRAVRIKRRRRVGSIGLRGLAISHLAGCRRLILEPTEYSPGWSSVRPLPLAGGQADGGQQARKALLDDVVAPGNAPVLALALGMHEPRLAQHPEVVRHRGLDDVVAQVPAVQGALIGDPAQDVAADGVGQGAQDRVQGDVARLGVEELPVLHGSSLPLCLDLHPRRAPDGG